MKTISSKDYVDKAEAAIKGLNEDSRNKKLTTTQIRKQLAMTAELCTQAEAETGEMLSDELQSKIEYLRVRFVYQAGREAAVKSFLEKAGIMEILKSVNGKREDFITFCKYMEALVAYHRFYGGKDA